MTWCRCQNNRCVISQSTGQKFDSSEEINLKVLQNSFRGQTLYSSIMINHHTCKSKERVGIVKKRPML